MNNINVKEKYPYLSEIKGSDKIISAAGTKYAEELENVINEFEHITDDEFWKRLSQNRVPRIYAVYSELETADDYLRDLGL